MAVVWGQVSSLQRQALRLALPQSSSDSSTSDVTISRKPKPLPPTVLSHCTLTLADPSFIIK